MKLDTNYVFPYKYWDAFYKNVKWDGDKLHMTICKCYENETFPNELEVVFHGVTWMRTTILKNYPPIFEEDWTDGYDPNKPLEEYLLVDREQFNNDFIAFISDNQEGIRCLADNVVFINETLFFDCTDIEIVRAECIDYMAREASLKKRKRFFGKRRKES